MIDLKHRLAMLSTPLPCAAIKGAVAPKLAHEVLPAKRLRGEDLLGAYDAKFGGGVSPADRPRLLSRLIGSARIVDCIVRSKVIAHPVDSRVLEIARCKTVSAANPAGTRFKQTVARQGKTLRPKAGGDFHAKQRKLLRNTAKRLRTILGVMVRQVRRKLDTQGCSGCPRRPCCR